MTRRNDFPPLFTNESGTDASTVAHAKQVKLKWLLLSGIFAVVSVVGLSWVYSQPAVYQSEAVLEMSNAGPDFGYSSVSLLEQIGRIKHKITRRSLYVEVQKQMQSKHQQQITSNDIANNLVILPDLTSQKINVQFTGSEPQLVQTTLEVLLAEFFTVHNEDLRENNSLDLAAQAEAIENVDQQIEITREQVSELAKENRIVSLQGEENQAIAQLKSINDKLNQAIARVDEGVEQLARIELARQLNSPMLHPDDTDAIAALETQIGGLEREFEALGRRYTEAYLSLDPALVEKQARLKELKQQLLFKRETSAEKYEQAVKLDIALDKESVKGFEQRIDDLNAKAQAFSFTLQEYARLNDTLEQLETQKDLFEQRLAEAAQRRELQVSMAEEPFLPDSPIGPDYMMMSLYVIGIAALSGVAVLVLFTYINRQSASTAVNNLTVVPNMMPNGNNSAQLIDAPKQELIAEQQQEKLQQQALLSSSPALQLLTQENVQALYNVSNELTQSVILLAMAGVAEDEVATLDLNSLDIEHAQIMLEARLPRTLSVKHFGDHAIEMVSKQLTRLTHLSSEDITNAIVNSAIDAQIANAESLDYAALRQTYMAFLLSQGMKINQLESVVGYTKADQLVPLRQFVNSNPTDAIGVIEYPLQA